MISLSKVKTSKPTTARRTTLAYGFRHCNQGKEMLSDLFRVTLLVRLALNSVLFIMALAASPVLPQKV
jgi:hypothetical protein